MPELSAYLLFSVLLISFEDGFVNRAEGGFVPPGPTPPLEDNASPAVTDGSVNRQTFQPQEHQVHTSSILPSGPPLALRVWVKDASSQRSIEGASVEVFVNSTQFVSALTQSNGEVLLSVPYVSGQTLSIVASMEGYVHRQMPWKTTKMPIFSSVTLALLPQTQGNIWLFEDSVLITQKTSEHISQPRVQFPKSLLELPDNTNISMVTAYLTVPPIDTGCHLCTIGLLSNRSGFRSVRLSPVAWLSTQLLANGKELPISGPIQITVPLPHGSRWGGSDSVHAWAFDRRTGAWLNKGLGTVKREGDVVVWTYVASQLGDWLAAPIPTLNGYAGHGAPSLDSISYHMYLLMATLGGTLLIAIGVLSVILCHCRHSSRERVRRRNSSRVVLQKDQTTSTSCDGDEESPYSHDDRTFSLATMAQRNASTTPRHQASYNIYVEDVGRPFKLYENVDSMGVESSKPPMPSVYVNSEEVARLRELSDQNRGSQGAAENVVFKDKLFHIYNQPVAIVPAPELFAGHPPPPQADSSGCRSATFPRNGAEHGPQSDRNLKDSFTQTLPKNTTQDSDEQPVLEVAQVSAINPGVWGRYSHLLESVSVPGTLNEAVGMGPFRAELQGISEQTLVELSKAKPSPHPPRAWFVSLDGKPAAQVRHSVIEIQGRHRPGSSNDTSLDSGVDMNEHQQPLLKMEREGPSLPVMPKASGPVGHEEPDLSSSEIGSPEDGALRHTLESSNTAMAASSLSEERDVGDTSSESRGTPPPRRPKKVRDKGRPDKKSARHVREERPQMKR